MRSLLVACLTLPIWGQPSPPRFESGANLALVRFSVMRAGAFVDELQRSDVSIEEDGIPRDVALLEGGRFNPRRTAAEVELVFDCSGSMRGKNVPSTVAFKSTLLDRVPFLTLSIFGFSGAGAWQFAGPTRDVAPLRQGIAKLAHFGGGSTLLFSSMLAILRGLPAASEERMRTMVVFSDGISGDGNHAAVVARAHSMGMTIYPVLEPFDESATAIEVAMRARFKSLAEETGGVAFEADTSLRDPMARILNSVAESLRHEYVAGVYLPLREQGNRTLRVKLRTSFAGEVLGGYRAIGR